MRGFPGVMPHVCGNSDPLTAPRWRLKFVFLILFLSEPERRPQAELPLPVTHSAEPRGGVASPPLTQRAWANLIGPERAQGVRADHDGKKKKKGRKKSRSRSSKLPSNQLSLRMLSAAQQRRGRVGVGRRKRENIRRGLRRRQGGWGGNPEEGVDSRPRLSGLTARWKRENKRTFPRPERMR